MPNYKMTVEFFNNDVRCETEGLMVSLNDLMIAGNCWRGHNGLPHKRLVDIIGTQAFDAFTAAVCKRIGKNKEEVYRTTKGRTGGTMANIYIAIYVAEQMSPEFHVAVIETFVEGKLLEFRELGGTEFKTLNAAIDKHLPGGGSLGKYINAAKMIRRKILGKDADTNEWGGASVDQTHRRYEVEKQLSEVLRLGVVRDWEHLKELIEKI